MRRRHILRDGSATVALTALTLFAGWWQVDGPATPSSPGPFPLPLAEMAFKLVDHEGQSVGPQSLVGRPTMVFFGFTYCPDVCPTTLSDITSWLDALGEVAAQLNVIFITVDPARDTVEVLSQYISYFHGQIRGWTGSAAEISRAARDFRVSYEKVSRGGDAYTMNHTASVFLFDAGGRYISNIDYHESREFAVPKILRAIDTQSDAS